MPDQGFTALTTGRLTLRRFRRADLAAFVAYRSDPAVARYQSWDAPYPVEAAELFLAGLDEIHPDTPGEWFQFVIALRGTDEAVGDCAAFTRPDDPRQAVIGYSLATAHQGRGYATEAVTRLLEYLLVERGKHRVSADCDARNTRSAALLERVGMRREGLMRSAIWSKGDSNQGEWCDDLLYAVLRDEWTAARMEA